MAKRPPKKRAATKKPALEKPSPSRRKSPLPSTVRPRSRAAAAVELARDLSPTLHRNTQSAERLIEDIERRKARISDDFIAIGRALRELSEPRLYRAAGYTSFKALLRGRKLTSPGTAFKLMAVADAFTQKQAGALGFEKAYALVRYVEATPAADVAVQLAQTNPRIGNRRLSTITVRELQDATRRVALATGTKTKPTEQERTARKKARALQRALRDRGAKSARVRPTRQDGQWKLQVTLEVEDADAVMELS